MSMFNIENANITNKQSTSYKDNIDSYELLLSHLQYFDS